MFMFLPLLIGKKEWNKPYKDYGANYHALYCPNCHNYSVSPVNRREFLTLIFIPFIPFYWGKQLRCATCGWHQDFKTHSQLEKVVMEQKNIREGATVPNYSD